MCVCRTSSEEVLKEAFRNLDAAFLRRYPEKNYMCAKETCKMCKRDLYMGKSDHTSECMMRCFCAGIQRRPISVQKRPVKCMKETYIRGKENLFLNADTAFLCRYAHMYVQQTPVNCVKETYV